MVKEYKVVEARTINLIVDDLNKHAEDDWTVSAYEQGFGFTKVLLERDRKEGNNK